MHATPDTVFPPRPWLTLATLLLGVAFALVSDRLQQEFPIFDNGLEGVLVILGVLAALLPLGLTGAVRGLTGRATLRAVWWQFVAVGLPVVIWQGVRLLVGG